LKRFEREARMLAALNHPNIGAIHGLEDTDGMRALVLELVDGETLADRIARGPLPLKDALAAARQIADALDVAHERGIVHRDLKPSNVALTRDGTLKVLDFGLAKATCDGQSPDLTDSPTMTDDRTRDGIILGTTAYMSPEQARGQTVDKRTDIWAFGCVLYEMLAGRAAFARDTVTDTLAAILERDPDWAALSPTTSHTVRRFLARCLEKDPKRRLRDIGDARVELEDPPTGERVGLGGSIGAPRAKRRWRAWTLGAAAAVLAALGALAFAAGPGRFGPGGPDTSSYRFVPLAVAPVDETSPSWSPDGRSIVYVAEVGAVSQLFTRSFDSAVSTQITKASISCLRPFWSPDGARVYFISSDQLWSVGATGGEPQLVLDDVSAATVAPDGKTLAFLRGPGGRSLWITGTAKLEPHQYQTLPFPQTFGLSSSLEFSPDGTRIGVLVRRQEGASYTSELWTLPYPTGTPRRVLERIPDAAGARLSWTPDSRYIVWDSAFPDRIGIHLYLADTERSTIRPITTGTVDERSPSVSPTGDRVAFASGSDDFDLIDVPLDGSDVRTLLASARSETRPTWSPTGKQLSYVTNARGKPEIWTRSVEEDWTRPLVVRDLDGKALGQPVQRPSYSPDGQRIVYEDWGTNHAVVVASVADGRGVPLDAESPDQHSPAWSSDGKWIAYQRLQGANWELVKVPSGGGKPVRLAEATPGGGDHTAWSPTGEWIANVRGGALQLTSAADGQTQKALGGAPPTAFGFSLDGSLLYAVRHASDGAWLLAAFDVQSGKERRITELRLPPRATLTGFSLHPSGKASPPRSGSAPAQTICPETKPAIGY
jgi:eukaryotic-like serine/threonine-protein kinase